MSVPGIRVRTCNIRPVRTDGAFVLYWMTAFRRPRWNFALQRAVDQAHLLGKPLVVLEALRCGYRWASDRVHAFVTEGMAGNRRAFEGGPVTYFPYVKPEPGGGRGLLEALAADTCLVVADDAPLFCLPRMLAAAGARLGVMLEAVDSNGLLPLVATDRVFSTAFSFRRFMQATLPEHVEDLPLANPLRGAELPQLGPLPEGILRRWPATPPALLESPHAAFAPLPLDHGVAAVRGSNSSSEANSNDTRTRGTTPMTTPPAGSPRTCTSGTSPSTRSSPPSVRGKGGRRGGCPRGHRAGGRGGGG